MKQRLKHAIRALFSKHYIIVTADKNNSVSMSYDCPAHLFDIARTEAVSSGKRVINDGTPVQFEAEEWFESNRAVDEANDIINGIG